MAEHGGRCVYCGVVLTADPRHFLHYNYATLDHAVPRSRGGAGLAGNRTLACRRCNQAKGSMLPDEFRARVSPAAPCPSDPPLDSAATAGDSRVEADSHAHTHGTGA